MGKGLNKLFNATKRKIREGILFSDKSAKESYKLFDETLVLLNSVGDCIHTSNGDLVKIWMGMERDCVNLQTNMPSFTKTGSLPVCVRQSQLLFTLIFWNHSGV